MASDRVLESMSRKSKQMLRKEAKDTRLTESSVQSLECGQMFLFGVGTYLETRKDKLSEVPDVRTFW